MTSEQRQDTQVEYVLDLANRVFRELLPIIPKEVLQFDLTMPQLKVVLLLFLNGQMRMSDIASALGVSLATATGVVDRLVDREIILRDTDASDRLWTIGRVCLWPAALFVGGHIKYRVPVDDENTLSVCWHFSRVPREREPYVQNSIPTWRGHGWWW